MARREPAHPRGGERSGQHLPERARGRGAGDGTAGFRRPGAPGRPDVRQRSLDFRRHGPGAVSLRGRRARGMGGRADGLGADMKSIATAFAVLLALPLSAQQPPPRTAAPAAPAETLRPAPNRRADEGKGPYRTMVIRGATLIDGTGAPPRGPVDIVVEGNRITSVRSAGTPGLPMRAN